MERAIGMDREFVQNEDYKITNAQVIAEFVVKRKQNFKDWVEREYTNRYSIDELVTCIDNISLLAISKNYSMISLWEYKNPNEFQEIYNYVLRTEIFKNFKSNTHKMYITGSIIYSRFLKKIESYNTSKPTYVDSENTIELGPSLDNKVSTFRRVQEADITNLLEKLKLKFVDKRDSGGAIWVLGGRELFVVMKKLNSMGIRFIFKEGGGRSSNFKDAWWYKIKTDSSVASEKSNEDLDIEATASERPLISEVHHEEIEKLEEVLKLNFAKGLRLNSPIELTRFKNFYLDKFSTEVNFTDNKLKEHLLNCGILFDNKIYSLSDEVKELIMSSVNAYFDEGAQVIFFCEFYYVNENWLFMGSVVSEEMLVEILMELFPQFKFSQNFFGQITASINSVVEMEILRVWGENLILTYEELNMRLKYIPLERIRNTLGQNENFIWNSLESFLHVSRVEIDDDQRQRIFDTAEQDCNEHGFTSISNLPTGEIENRYSELSTSAIQNLIFRICLSDKFDKKGKIVIRKGDTLDALSITKGYCRTLESCSLEDLLNYEKELTGEIHRYIPMEAGSSVMVRINENTYIADKYLYFDIEMIDLAIDKSMQGEYMSLKAFITFGAFPDCGQTWNLFLLESYCRRFSKCFRFDSISLNSCNSGAIIRKSCRLSYDEILVDAVKSSGISLSKNSIGRFLKDTGYISRKTTNRINHILNRVKIIKQRKG